MALLATPLDDLDALARQPDRAATALAVVPACRQALAALPLWQSTGDITPATIKQSMTNEAQVYAKRYPDAANSV